MKYAVMIVISTMGGAPAEIGFADRARCESASRAVAAHVYSVDCYSVERTDARPSSLLCEVRRDRIGAVVIIRNASRRSIPAGARYAYRTRSNGVVIGRFSGRLPRRLHPGGKLRDYFSGHGIDSCDATLR